ncbi:hypothetical protein Zmor_002294 [Zophobas morio]|uniref:PID domain-containing protein n=1 Tax=Zophobas morio TaxID=2755281 RepID=A0AA38J7A6_9CUCU|nr:hypothetical protein Zmor_002294 [Zophobas morio]
MANSQQVINCPLLLQIVHMAHALRRISYATCDPEHRLFSFFAREPKGHFNQQYCHSFISRSSEQVSGECPTGGLWPFLAFRIDYQNSDNLISNDFAY